MRKNTRRLVVEIDAKLHKNFTKAVGKIGSKKGFAIERMIEDFLLQAETYPKGYPFFTASKGDERERRS